MTKYTKIIFNYLAAGLLSLIKLTLRFEVQNQPKNLIVVYGFWHRNLMYCALQRAGDPIAVMVSSSKDGELIAGPLSVLGYSIVRGSSSRRGSQALKGMLRYAREKSLAITPDGPKGPLGTIHPGMFQLALLARIPIVGVACHTNREWVFNSWDRFRFPKPFAKILIEYSEPFYVNSKDDIPMVEKKFRAFLDTWEQNHKSN
ncbi:MAG: lysophospholipid acyltransferase family protein [Candidatus Cloacimonetes bacterium]|nr:lysophospholipid acyltransferase family protein [Candidatus Cloacimonadota bacterium]